MSIQLYNIISRSSKALLLKPFHYSHFFAFFLARALLSQLVQAIFACGVRHQGRIKDNSSASDCTLGFEPFDLTRFFFASVFLAQFA